MVYRFDDPDERPRFTVRNISICGLFIACSLICGLLESRFPLPFPGMRLGLSNVFYLLALSLLGAPEALCVAALRLLLLFAITGNLFAMSCSAAGLVLSMPLTIFLYKAFDHVLSLQAISVASAAAFNFGQLCAVCLMTGEAMLLTYYPPLMAAGAAAGFAMGTAAEIVRDRVERFFDRRS